MNDCKDHLNVTNIVPFQELKSQYQNSFYFLRLNMPTEEHDDLFSGRLADGSVNLVVGAPGPDTLKKSAELFDSATRNRTTKVTSSGDVSLFQYGPVCGNREYLHQLANFLTKEYDDQVRFTFRLKQLYHFLKYKFW